jgi:hypothetical protein
MIGCTVSGLSSQEGDVPSGSDRGCCNALAGPLTGPAHCALLRVVVRLAGLPRNGALALSKWHALPAAPTADDVRRQQPKKNKKPEVGALAHRGGGGGFSRAFSLV